MNGKIGSTLLLKKSKKNIGISLASDRVKILKDQTSVDKFKNYEIFEDK